MGSADGPEQLPKRRLVNPIARHQQLHCGIREELAQTRLGAGNSHGTSSIGERRAAAPQLIAPGK
jgi:hypothetical protein